LDQATAYLASYPMIILLDFILPMDTSARKIDTPLLARIPLYIFMVILMPWMYVAFFNYMQTSLAGGTLTWVAALGATTSLLWINVLPNIPVLHELGHGRGRFDVFLSYVGCLFIGNFSRMITHTHVHHIHASTIHDPDTPRRGESILAFAVRAAYSNWVEIYKMDQKRLQGQGFFSFLRSWFFISILVQSTILALTYYFFGGVIALCIAGATFGAMFFLEVFNYLQHYGIVRKPEDAFAPRHVWNHLQAATRAFSYDITNHTPHHLAGDSPFQKNIPDTEAPSMISPLFLLTLALVLPPVWTALVAKPKLKHWDLNYASPEELLLAREANQKAGWPDWFSETNIEAKQESINLKTA
ncbi:MAG: fatty acid desaturase, partial [Spirochaetota bacterium]